METLEKYFVADLVAEVGSLPAVGTRIVSLTSDPDCCLADLSRVIASDAVLAMRFLSLANSAAFSRGQEIKDLQTALARLGLRRVRNVALLMGMHDMLPGETRPGPLCPLAFWRHVLATASCASALAELRRQASPDDAWLTGLLHGIGVLSLAQKIPEPFQGAVINARRRKIPLAEAELGLLEFHHGELGGRLLTQWGLPSVFAEAVEFHPENFDPGEVSPAADALIDLLRDAIVMVRASGCGDSGDGTPVPSVAELGPILGLDEEAMTGLAATVDADVAEMSDLAGIEQTGDTFQQALGQARDQVARLGLEGIDEGLVREGLEQELALAREIQQKLIPEQAPDPAGFSLSALNLPSRQTSGDFYDFLDFPDGQVGIVIADVSGKSIPAALLAGTVQATLRALCLVSDDPGYLLSQANNALFASTDPEHFATLFLAVINADGTGFRYASAAHDPPLLLAADGQTTWLPPAGTPLGLFPDVSYPVTNVALEPGDRLIAYTDGLTEAVDPHGSPFGRDGLEQAVRNPSWPTGDPLLTSIREAVEAHVHPAAGNGSLADDLTLVTLTRDMPDSASPHP